MGAAPKSIELETRVARMELILTTLEEAVTVLNKRVIAMQAHLDHITARLGRG